MGGEHGGHHICASAHVGWAAVPPGGTGDRRAASPCRGGWKLAVTHRPYYGQRSKASESFRVPGGGRLAQPLAISSHMAMGRGVACQRVWRGGGEVGRCSGAAYGAYGTARTSHSLLSAGCGDGGAVFWACSCVVCHPLRNGTCSDLGA